MSGVQAEELLESMRLVRQDLANYSLKVEGLPNQLQTLTILAEGAQQAAARIATELGAMRNVFGASLDVLSAEISESRQHSKERDFRLAQSFDRIELEQKQVHHALQRFQELLSATHSELETIKTLQGNTYTAIAGRGHADDRRAADTPAPARKARKRPPG
jgi:DNA repair exonuclease SbcCD ATPase subunit